MTDLNDWRLLYSGIPTFDFGPNSTDYPFSTQVDIGEVDIVEQDTRHQSSDALLMGRDTLGGFELTFTLTTIPEYPTPAKPWDSALDKYGTFVQKWRANQIRTQPGVYATLRNLDRARLVYGRPRKISLADTSRLRKGILRYVATFQTVHPDFYSTTEDTANLVSGAGASFNNSGDTDSWPKITLRGPFTDGSVHLTQDAITLWQIDVPGPVAAGQTLTLDTAPWARSALLNGAPANGMLRGDPLSKVKIPVGVGSIFWSRTDATNTSSGDVKWRDAYSSL